MPANTALTRPQRDSLLHRLAQDYTGTPNKRDLPALTKWTDEYLFASMADHKVSIAVTPNGRADALHTLPNGTRYFVEPHTEQMTMQELVQAISTSEQDPSSEVFYLQSQNGNMYSAQDFDSSGSGSASELAPLLPDVPREIPWASEALDRTPDAVNIWIGGSRSVTSVHSDPYENIYAVVRGAKHFTLLPPTEGYTLNEQRVPHARFTRPSPGSPLVIEPISDSSVRWAEVDPTLTESVSGLRVTVDAGDALYLPAGWWHHVAQSGDSGGLCVAVNWWYDVEMRGMKWTWMAFLRRLAAPEGEDEEEESV